MLISLRASGTSGVAKFRPIFEVFDWYLEAHRPTIVWLMTTCVFISVLATQDLFSAGACFSFVLFTTLCSF